MIPRLRTRRCVIWLALVGAIIATGCARNSPGATASAPGSPTTEVAVESSSSTAAAAPATSSTADAPTVAPSPTTVAPAQSTRPTIPATTTTLPPTVHHAFPIGGGARADYSRAHHDYPATDIFADCGSPLVSPVDGTVIHVRRIDHYDPNVANPATLGGRSVAVLGRDGVRYYEAHLQSIDDRVVIGLEVSAGEPLGVLGKTGDAGVCHVHFGISAPCSGLEWSVRRGVIWPWPYLDKWRAGDEMNPVLEIYAWSTGHPDACDVAMALPTAKDSN
jgi:peptidoglycan LD-endopeptidase LytH